MKVFLSALLLSLFTVFSPLSHAAFTNDNCEYLPGTYKYAESDDQYGSIVNIASLNDGYKMIVTIWEKDKSAEIVTNINNCKDGQFKAWSNGTVFYYGTVDKNQLILSNWGSFTYQRIG